MGLSKPLAKVALVAFSLLDAAIPTDASQANPDPFNVTQPSTGKNITLHIQGGERFNWLSEGTGIEGFTVLRTDDGDFVYANIGVDGLLEATEHLVGEVDPIDIGLEPNLLPTQEVWLAWCLENELRCAVDEVIEDAVFEDAEPGVGDNRKRRMQKTPAMGDIKNLVVLMRWSDHLDRTMPTEEDIEIIFNHEGPHELAPTGSVRDVYWINSYNQLNLTSTVYKWVDMDNTEVYYADGTSGGTDVIKSAFLYALDQLEADETFDFGEFDQNGDGYIDAIAFLHSGYAAEWGGTDAYGTYYTDRIWSHKWDLASVGDWESASSGVKVSAYHISPAVWGLSGSEVGRIGVIAHETGHFFGLPDLYDGVNYGQGIGSWCLMSNSWGFDNTQLYPPHFSAWCRVQLGWDTPTVITEPGSYSITASEELQEMDGAPRMYRIDKEYPVGEYLLIENRQPLYFDELVPQGGLAVWKIDATQKSGQGEGGFPEYPGWPENGAHYRNALLQADRDFALEKGVSIGDATDVYHAGVHNEISQSTNVNEGPFPNTDSYSEAPNVFQTGHRIYEIGSSDVVMTFKYENLAEGEMTPTEAPTTSGGVMRLMTLPLIPLALAFLVL